MVPGTNYEFRWLMVFWRIVADDGCRLGWTFAGTCLEPENHFREYYTGRQTIRGSVILQDFIVYVRVSHQTDGLSASAFSFPGKLQHKPCNWLGWRCSNKTKVCHKIFSMCHRGKEKKTDCRLWLFVTMAGHLNREVQVYRGVKLLNLSFCPPTIPENCSLKQNLLDQ